jgi:hypothetical protein
MACFVTARQCRILAATAIAAAMGAPLPSLAQSSMGSREFQTAELGELSPELRAEVLNRATGQNTPRGVLETMLLNAIQQRFPASRIVATDMGRGVAVIATPENQMRALTFNKQQGLQVVGEVMLTP